MSGATHIVVPHKPSSQDVQAIADAVGPPDRRGLVKDVVVVCSLARTQSGRALMRKRLCHAGLSGHTAAILGWSTVAPRVDPAPAAHVQVPEPEPLVPEPDFTMPKPELELPELELHDTGKLKPRRRRKP